VACQNRTGPLHCFHILCLPPEPAGLGRHDIAVFGPQTITNPSAGGRVKAVRPGLTSQVFATHVFATQATGTKDAIAGKRRFLL